MLGVVGPFCLAGQKRFQEPLWVLGRIPGTHNLIPSLFGFRTALLRLQDAADHCLQPLKEGFVPKWPASTAVTPQVLEFLFRHGTVEKGIPVADHRQQRCNFSQAIVAARQVRPGAAPTPVGGIRRQSREEASGRVAPGDYSPGATRPDGPMVQTPMVQLALNSALAAPSNDCQESICGRDTEQTDQAGRLRDSA